MKAASFSKRYPGVRSLALSFVLLGFQPCLGAGLTVANGPLTVGNLPFSAYEDVPLCSDASTGRVGRCDPSDSNVSTRVAWVGDGPAADYASPVDAMLDVDNWCPTRNSCVLNIAPGSYLIGSNALELPGGVSIRGSGVESTFIFGTVNGVGSLKKGLISVYGDQTGISDLTVYHQGSGTALSENKAVYVGSTGDVRIHNVRLISGSTEGLNIALHVDGGKADVVGSELDAYNSVGYGVYAYDGIAELKHSEVSGGTGTDSRAARAYSTSQDAAQILITHSHVIGTPYFENIGNNGVSGRIRASHSMFSSSGGTSTIGDVECVATTEGLSFYSTGCP